MSENVIVSQSGGVLEIRLSRPEKKNALTRPMYAAMADAFQASNGDPSIRVVLLTGTGDIFCSGNDVGDFKTLSNAPIDRHARVGNHFLPSLTSMTKPLIGAVNGAAIGIGTTMLLHCDLLIAASHASFRMPFTSLGLIAEAGSSLLLPQIIGVRRANAMLMMGQGIDAETALAWGLINQVVDAAELMTTAHAMACQLAALPAQAVRATKALIQHGASDLPGRIAEELSELDQRLVSPEAREAFTAFIEKRRPDFSQFH
jgi:enoyl-CoA hydratase/carnithine racemase